ncbi:MAG: hypothetical protein ACP5GL_07005 [Infirmifilum sp.]
MKTSRIIILLLTFLILTAHLTLSETSTWSSSTLTFNGFDLLSMAVSPSGRYFAVVLGDRSYYSRTLRIYDASLNVVDTLQLSSFSEVSVSFLNDTYLVIAEYIWSSQVPFSYIHLLNLKEGKLLTSPKIPATYLQSINKAVVVGRTLYLLTPRYLLGLDIDTLSKTYIRGFLNRGLELLAINQSLFILSVETHCPLCLMQNEKNLTIVTPSGEKSITYCHVLQMVNLPNNRAGILYDNGTLAECSVQGGAPFCYGKTQVPVPVNLASEPNYKLLYALNIAGLEVNLIVFNVSDGITRKYHLPLPYAKGDIIGLRVYDDGYFLAWDNDTIVLGSPAGFEGIIKAETRVIDAFYAGEKIYVASPNRVTIFERKIPSELHSLRLDAFSEDGTPISNFTVLINGKRISSNDSSVSLWLPRGVYNITVSSPKHYSTTFTLNLSSDIRKSIVLKRIRYSLIVHASTSTGDQPDVLVYRGNTPIARGVGILKVDLLPGNYTLLISYGNTSVLKKVELLNYTEISITLNTTPPLVPEKPHNQTSTQPPMNSTEAEYIIMYGEKTCPECQRTKETLQKLSVKVFFKDIAGNQTYLNEYDTLYQLCGAGNLRIVPLTLVFKGNNLIAVVAGSLPAEGWSEVLKMNFSGKTLVIMDNGGQALRDLNSTLIYEIAVKGLTSLNSSSKPKENILPLILVLAASDSVNPCTFMIFAVLVTAVMSFSGRRKATITAASFISAVYISYMTLGLGLIHFIASFTWLKYVVGLLSIIAGAYSLAVGTIAWREGCREDKRAFPRGLMRLSERLRGLNKLKDKVNVIQQNLLTKARSGGIYASFLAGVLVSFTLLPCSSGPYLVASYVLSQEDTATAIGVLLLYNLVFVLPLVLIAAGVIIGGKLLMMVDFATVQLNALRRWTGILLGIILVLLGVFIVFFH